MRPAVRTALRRLDADQCAQAIVSLVQLLNLRDDQGRLCQEVRIGPKTLARLREICGIGD